MPKRPAITAPIIAATTVALAPRVASGEGETGGVSVGVGNGTREDA